MESMRSGGAIPPLKRGISAILARYPLKTWQMGAIPPSAILSRKGIARYGGVSRTRPLGLSWKDIVNAGKADEVGVPLSEACAGLHVKLSEGWRTRDAMFTGTSLKLSLIFHSLVFR